MIIWRSTLHEAWPCVALQAGVDDFGRPAALSVDWPNVTIRFGQG
jgi:hypothetical protein